MIFDCCVKALSTGFVLAATLGLLNSRSLATDKSVITDNVILVDSVVNTNVAVSFTNDLDTYVEHALLYNVERYANSVMFANGYVNSRLFDVALDENGEGAFHLTFDDEYYICVWVSLDREPLVLYKCKLTERLIENWEFI